MNWPVVEPLFTASQLLAVRNEALEEARRAVLAEVLLDLEEPICKEDLAYNSALNDAQTAIRSLRSGALEGEKPCGS